MTIVGRTAQGSEASSATSVTATLPPDLANNDVVIAFFSVPGTASGHFTGPASWTSLFTPLVVNDNNVIGAYYRVKDAGWSSAPVASSSQAASRTAATCQAYAGVSNSNPIDVAVQTQVSNPGTSIVLGAMTPTVAGTQLVTGAILDSSTGDFSPTTPSGTTLLASTTGGGVGRGMTLADEFRSGTGSTGTRTWAVPSSLGLGGFALLLRPGSVITPSGSITATGTVKKVVTKNAFTGSITATGAFSKVKVVVKTLTGSVTAAGTFAKLTLKVLTGSSTATGTLAKQTKKNFAGSITSTGFYKKAFVRTFTGAITATGNVVAIFAGRIFGKPGIVRLTAQKAGEIRMRIRRS